MRRKGDEWDLYLLNMVSHESQVSENWEVQYLGSPRGTRWPTTCSPTVTLDCDRDTGPGRRSTIR
jgi:hypothetical protein